MDMKLELELIPVSDVDRARRSTRSGWVPGRRGHDADGRSPRRAAHVPGIGLLAIRHFDRDTAEWRPGADPEHGDYGSFADFADPDGNTRVLQEVGHHGGEG